MISAKNAKDVKYLRTQLAAAMPEGVWHYPADQLSVGHERDLAAEITREKLFLMLHHELPYHLHVETEKWEAQSNLLHLSQVIVVSRESHKKMVIGKGGETLKRVGTQARKEMEKILGRKIHLTLFVKVRPGWKEDRQIYAQLGLLP